MHQAAIDLLALASELLKADGSPRRSAIAIGGEIRRCVMDLETNHERLEKERDDFMLSALVQYDLASHHSINRFLGWVRRNSSRIDIPELIDAFFKDEADRCRKEYAREEALGCTILGWVPRARTLEEERKDALAGKETTDASL